MGRLDKKLSALDLRQPVPQPAEPVLDAEYWEIRQGTGPTTQDMRSWIAQRPEWEEA